MGLGILVNLPEFRLHKALCLQKYKYQHDNSEVHKWVPPLLEATQSLSCSLFQLCTHFCQLSLGLPSPYRSFTFNSHRLPSNCSGVLTVPLMGRRARSLGKGEWEGPGQAPSIIFWLHHSFQYEIEVKVKVAQSCPTLWPHRLHSPWNFLGQNTGVGSLSLLQWIFPTQESTRGLLHCRRILYQYYATYPSLNFPSPKMW